MRIKICIQAIALILATCFTCFAQRNPYKEIGKKAPRILTLTNGEYEEFFDDEDVQQIGTILFDIHTGDIVKLLTKEEAEKRLENTVAQRFLSVDPLAASYPMLTPYQYASNSPVSGVDLDGLEFYYATDGKFLGNRTKDANGKPLPKDVINDVRIASSIKETPEYRIFNGVKSLNIQHSEFIKFAAISYSESSVGNGLEIKEEVYGIASAMVNFKNLTKKNSIAYAATDGNPMFSKFVKANDDQRNGNFMQTTIAGAINALTGGPDYSNKGTHWAGNDIGSSTEKRAEGLKFSETSHDLFNLGDNAVPGEHYLFDKNKKPIKIRGSWDYKWQTTAAYGGMTPKGTKSGTTFMKVSDEYKYATGNKGQ